MTGHLLLITIGPVQEFIAQARRTRDLWYGSHLLSELSRAAAATVVESGGKLIFPALDKDVPEERDELSVWLKPLRNNGKPPRNIANKVLAELPASTDPKSVAEEVRKTVGTLWEKEIAEQVKVDCADIIVPADAVWTEQIRSLIEFAATWAPVETGGDGYKKARERLEKAIAARKNLRDFEPWKQQRGDVPKSSLDGARETVLRQPELRDKYLARKYRIARTEQLDAVSLVKRAGGNPEQFVPLVNVALGPWLAYAQEHYPDQMGRLRGDCKAINLARVDRPDLPCAAALCFDASILLASRWRPVFEEQELRTSTEAEAWCKAHVGPLLAALSEPYPYVACLVADGDHMGSAIDRIADADAHRSFSRHLAGFALEARHIVEQEYLGSLVFAGGDDVLAFLPLPKALGCAEALRNCFSEKMRAACAATSEHDDLRLPTLSVGIGIGHIMEGMGDLLTLGRRAEKLAKGGGLPEGHDRNALAILLDKRSGGMRSWRSQWTEWANDPAGRLQLDAEAFGGLLSKRKVYEIARTLERLPDAQDVADAEEGSWADALRLEVGRSLSRMDTGDGSLAVRKVAEIANELGLPLARQADYATLRETVASWADRVLIAAVIAAATPRLRNRAKEVAA